MLKAVNAAHSAYAQFTFEAPFFDHYALLGAGRRRPRRAVADAPLMHVFRSLPMLERSALECRVPFNATRSLLAVVLRMRDGSTREYNLRVMDYDPISAAFDAAQCPNLIGATSAVLLECFSKFAATLDEVTLDATDARVVRIKNAIGHIDSRMSSLFTDLAVPAEQFEKVAIARPDDHVFACASSAAS